MSWTGRSCIRAARLVALAALAAWVMVGQPAAAKTLKVIIHADLSILDPVWTTAGITREHGYMIYDTLFAMDEHMQPQPQMVDGYTVSPDGLTYTFKLRDGLKWSDGTPVTAADCVASIKRWSAKDSMGQRLAALTDAMSVVDDRTFAIKLKEKYGLVLQSLGRTSGNPPFMMPARVAATDPSQKITDTTGSGPFIFAKDEYRAGSKVVYLKNPNYVPRSEPASFLAGGKRALVDRVEWLYIPDQNTALAALQSGEADWWELPPNDLAPVMEKDPNIVVENSDQLGSQGILRPNWLLPPFDNVKARQALLYLVDQKEMMQAAVGDQKLWRLCPSYFTCGGAFESNVGIVGLGATDLDKAKALLAEGGYKGEPIVILDPTDEPVIHATALVTAQQLRKIGATVDVQAMDWSTLVSRRGIKAGTDKGGWNIFITYTGGDESATPLTNTAMVSTCDKAWFGWACDEEIEKLRSAWALESDPAKQKALADQIQARAFAVVPYVSYGQFFTPTAFRKTVSGRIPSSDTVFWNVDVKE